MNIKGCCDQEKKGVVKSGVGLARGQKGNLFIKKEGMAEEPNEDLISVFSKEEVFAEISAEVAIEILDGVKLD